MRREAEENFSSKKAGEASPAFFLFEQNICRVNVCDGETAGAPARMLRLKMMTGVKKPLS